MKRNDKSNQPRVVVLYGGVGPERDVSLVSGRAVMQSVQDSFPWEITGLELNVRILPPEICAERDVVLPVLHGEFGEDGQVQQLLENAGVEYCGCDARSSQLCMDKHATKLAWSRVGIPVVESVTIRSSKWGEYTEQQILGVLGNSIVIKPVGMGSSVGLQLIETPTELTSFLDSPQYRQQDWLLERRIKGREFSVGVLSGKAMGIVEIKVPEGRVYDYEQKYHRDDTVYECPACLSKAQTTFVQRLAEEAFVACGCRDCARIDFLYETMTDRWYALELNTLPGMTPTSLLPKSAAAAGFDFRNLLIQMIEPAVKRFLNRPTVRE